VTLVAAWVRTIKDTEELILATDSRLSGGHTWDCGPKIVPLRRGDCALCFAGNTAYAYPIIIHVQHYVEMYERALSRAQDLTDFKGHVLRVLDAMLRDVVNPVHPPQREFGLVLAGYSWRYQQFKIWSLSYDKKRGRFSFQRATSHSRRTSSTKKFWFIGDNTYQARIRLYNLLRKRHKLTVGGLDMEPFEILLSFIRDGRYRSIGGAPQVVKIYKHMNHLALNVLWPDASGPRTYLGRRLLDYEANRCLTLDPDSLTIVAPPP